MAVVAPLFNNPRTNEDLICPSTIALHASTNAVLVKALAPAAPAEVL